MLALNALPFSFSFLFSFFFFGRCSPIGSKEWSSREGRRESVYEFIPERKTSPSFPTRQDCKIYPLSGAEISLLPNSSRPSAPGHPTAEAQWLKAFQRNSSAPPSSNNTPIQLIRSLHPRLFLFLRSSKEPRVRSHQGGLLIRITNAPPLGR